MFLQYLAILKQTNSTKVPLTEGRAFPSFNTLFKHTLKVMKKATLFVFSLGWIPLFAQVSEKAYAKFDFIPGDKVLFEDNFTGESTDEIPSHWVISSGKVEMTKINGELVMGFLESAPKAYPRMAKNKKLITANRFTVEFDYLWRHNTKPFAQAIGDGNSGGDKLMIQFANDKEWDSVRESLGDFYESVYIYSIGNVEFKTFKGQYKSGKKVSDSEYIYEDLCDKWVHVSLAITEKSLKLYINSERVLNAPIESGQVAGIEIISDGTTYEMGSQLFLKNFRIAEGGTDPYKTLTTDGKFIARGIHFDVAKATIKPESMGTLNTMVAMMKEHPELKFEIGGHTDADGNDAANLKLSQERADAVKEKLVSLGVGSSKLTTKGYGKTKPISDNNTFEGKAENRRVEFIKL